MKGPKVITPPRWVGAAGRAWEVDPAVLPHQHTVVGLWLIEAPLAHPLWHSYVLSMVHLRPGPGIPAPVLHLPGATHEMLLQALEPEGDRQALLTRGDFVACKLLTPANFAAQMVCNSDEAAGARGRIAVWDMCSGVLSPDTDARQQWVTRFGGNMVRP